jgi:subtilisin-like proprotein convertase family protein
LVVPTLLAGCPDDGTSATGDDSSDTGSSDGSSSSSTSLDPDTSISTTIDPTMMTTVDPDSSSSSTSDESTTGFVGCGDSDVDLQAGETCDGENLDGRTCVTEDFAGGELACNADCTLDTSGCTFACGDGDVQGDEQCEGNEFEGADCMTLGFDGGELDCATDCTFITTGCEDYICGDGIVAGPEVCDGVNLDGEDCESQDFDSGTLACAADCNSFDVSSCFVCGDGVINGTEDCDGAALGGETCVSQGADGGVLSCANDCTFDVSECVGCGNGDQDPGEECDINDFGGTNCVQLGFDGGTPTCTAACEIVTDSCAGLHTFCTSPDAAIGPASGTLTSSTILVAGLAGEVLDVDVLVTGSHTAVGDLAIGVRHIDTDLSVALADNQCGAGDDINATFDQDAGAPPACSGTPTIAGAVQPVGNLDAYVTESLGPGNGSWELSVLDEANNNGGTLAQWCVAITTGSTLRPNLLDCGNSNRDISAFIPDGVELEVIDSCAPDENTQAILISRNGFVETELLQAYVAGGGIVLTEYNITDEVFNAIFDEAMPDNNGGNGSCSDVAPTVAQFSPGDPFWVENQFVAIPLDLAGCGANNIIDYPGVVPLAGWSANEVSIGYRDDGPGRVWLTEFDWSDNDMADYAYTEQLMGSMIVTDS